MECDIVNGIFWKQVVAIVRLEWILDVVRAMRFVNIDVCLKTFMLLDVGLRALAKILNRKHVHISVAL